MERGIVDRARERESREEKVLHPVKILLLLAYLLTSEMGEDGLRPQSKKFERDKGRGKEMRGKREFTKIYSV